MLRAAAKNLIAVVRPAAAPMTKPHAPTGHQLFSSEARLAALQDEAVQARVGLADEHSAAHALKEDPVKIERMFDDIYGFRSCH